MRRLLRTTQVTIIALLALGLLGGCERDEITERERAQMDRLARTGLKFKDDPYVRAETLRVLSIMPDKGLDAARLDLAKNDPSPMVRALALKQLAEARHPEAGELLSVAYKRARTPDERRVIMELVVAHGSEAQRNEIVRLGLKSSDTALRLIAFDVGVAPSVMKAKEGGDLSKLKAELLPEIGKYISAGDPVLAPRALEMFAAVGEDKRAQPLIDVVVNPKAVKAERVKNAEILWRAKVKIAREPIVGLIKADDANDGSKLGAEPEPPEVIKAALIASVGLNHEAYVDRTKAFLKGATEAETLELLEAFSANTSADASITLKVHMTDARDAVRIKAIELYSKREDAQANALIQATRQKDVRAKKILAVALVKRFPKEWGEALQKQLGEEGQVDDTLRLLREVITPEAAPKLIPPLAARLEGFTKQADKPERATLSALLLLMANPTASTYNAALLKSPDPNTRYAFLEILATHQAAASKAIFRKLLFDDLFTMRLMSGVGLRRAYAGSAGAAKQ